MNVDDIVDGPLIERGTVKWFDPIKGFGFVDSGAFDGEVLLHISPLRAYGLSSLAKGVAIEFEYEKTDKGVRINKVLNVIQPDVAFRIADLSKADFDSLVPAIVKWYDPARGFGFVRLFKDDSEIFFHSGVLEKSEVSSVTPGAGFAVLVDRSGERPVVQHIFEWVTTQTL